MNEPQQAPRIWLSPTGPKRTQGAPLPGDAAEHLSSLVGKGFQLVEAVIDLGIQMIDSVGVVAQRVVVDRLVPPSGTGAPAPPSAPAPATAAIPSELVVSNRVPVYPGGEARVPFSLNNDSETQGRRVRLHLIGFKGIRTGMILDAAGFSVSPSEREIAPMDFEKFVVRGLIPPNALPDAYDGFVVVSGEDELQIPLRLFVSAGAAGTPDAESNQPRRSP